MTLQWVPGDVDRACFLKAPGLPTSVTKPSAAPGYVWGVDRVKKRKSNDWWLVPPELWQLFGWMGAILNPLATKTSSTNLLGFIWNYGLQIKGGGINLSRSVGGNIFTVRKSVTAVIQDFTAINQCRRKKPFPVRDVTSGDLVISPCASW